MTWGVAQSDSVCFRICASSKMNNSEHFSLTLSISPFCARVWRINKGYNETGALRKEQMIELIEQASTHNGPLWKGLLL